MKKDLIFSVLILIVGILLFLLKETGMTAHIALSVVGLVLLVVYAVKTKKQWKKPALEVVMRVLYAVALISGVIILNVEGIAALAILHKVCAALFVIMLVVLFVQKVKSK